ncbi:hypothetical protein [Rhizobium sp. NPDC090279]|uniref:Pepco domain-containing protein n=1 Tax=Rhizobium sp. NPDC090279 TaxID=3364499 RepID=UPI00383B1B37
MDREIAIITDAMSPASPITEGHGSRGSDDIGGGFGSILGSPFKAVTLSADLLKTQMSNLLEVVSLVFDQSLASSTLALDEVQLSIEISSEGEVRILGSGGKIGGNGAIRLIFKKKEIQKSETGKS